jgi:hypothetical protein
MERLLPVLASLSRRCASITFARRADSRHTELRRRVARMHLPLASALGRLRRGLVLCDEAAFERHVRDVLARFYFEAHALARGLPNGERTPEVLALVDAVRSVERSGYISA